MELAISISALAVGLVSVGVAFWQGGISKQQLDLAKDTLKEIREATGETRRIVQDVKDNIDDRITKIIDSRIQSDQAKDASSTAITKMFMEGLMKSIGQQKPDEGEK